MAPVAWVDRPSNRHKTWRAHFRDHRGQHRCIQAFRNRRVSLAFAGKLDELCQAVASGSEFSNHTLQWIQSNLREDHRVKLVEWGVLGRRYLVESKPLRSHLEDWREKMRCEGRTLKHCDELFSRTLLVLVDECRYDQFSDIDPLRAQTAAQSLGRQRGWSPQTTAHYLKACAQFCRWMCEYGRAHHSPLAAMKIPTVQKSQHSRVRRALTEDEASGLINSVRDAGIVRGGMPGPERALMYRLVIYETGFRAGTVRSLRVKDFDLEGQTPVVTAVVKGGKTLCVPLSGPMAAALRDHFVGANKMVDDPAFNCPTVSWFADVLKMDLKEAGIPCAAFGKTVDFHALRHTFGTMASKVMDPRSLQEIMGHGDIRVTMGYYTHRLTSDLAAAKANMPSPCVASSVEVLQQKTAEMSTLRQAAFRGNKFG